MKLGETIEFDTYLKRSSYLDNDKPYGQKRRRFWKPVTTSNKKGIIIGIRNLQNGYVYREDDINVFVAEEYFKAYLVSYSLHRSPVYIKIDAVNEYNNPNTKTNV